MGWGIVGGAAVKSYNEQAKNSREAEWDDIRRKEYLRQLAQQQAIDAAANGEDPTAQGAAPVPMAPVADAPAAPAVQGGLRMPSGPVPVDASLAGAPNAQQAPSAPQAPAAPAPASQKQPRMSDQLFARADAMARAKGGALGLDKALQLRQHAVELAKQERDQDLMGILSAQVPGAQKVQQLLNYVNGSDTVPGDVSLEKRQDGVYMVHSAPGKDKPFAMKLDGASEDEVIGNLALKIRAMYDPALQLKLMDHNETKRYHSGLLDNTAERNANQMALGLAKLDSAEQIAAARQSARMAQIEAMSARAERGQWEVLGQDKDGKWWERDRVSGKRREMDLPPGFDMTKKLTGEKATDLTKDLTKREEKAYGAYLERLTGKESVADQIKLAKQFGLNPEKIGLPVGAIPDASMLKQELKSSAAEPAPAPSAGLRVPNGPKKSPMYGSFKPLMPNTSTGTTVPAAPAAPVNVNALQQHIAMLTQMVQKTAPFPAQQRDWQEQLQAAQAQLAAVQSK